MKSITVVLDPDTRAELYSDISDEFMTFVIIEAIVNIVKDFRRGHSRFYVPQETPYLDCLDALALDPDDEGEMQLASSVELLVDVVKAFDSEDGNDVESPDYGLDDEQIQWIESKLIEAINSITVGNCVGDFMMLEQLLTDTRLSQGLSVTARHLNNAVVLFVDSPVLNEFV